MRELGLEVGEGVNPQEGLSGIPSYGIKEWLLTPSFLVSAHLYHLPQWPINSLRLHDTRAHTQSQGARGGSIN